MMTPEEARREAEALQWIVRAQHPDFEQWDELTRWMAANPDNAEYFYRLSLREEEVVAAVRELTPSPRPATLMDDARSREVRRPAIPPVSLRRSRWGLLAASMALIIGFGLVALRLAGERADAPPAVMAIATQPGERRHVRLADGTNIEVAGATRLRIDPASHLAELDEGQATFSVVHDPRRTLVVRLGDLTVTDLGTVFDLRRRDGRAAIAVASGEVRVDRQGVPIQVSAGRRLRFDGAAAPELDEVAPDAVTDWQQGRFSYDDAPITQVVADIEQTTGAHITISPSIASRRFAGVITLDGDMRHALTEAAPVLGLSMSHSGSTWVLGPGRDTLRR